MTTDADTARLDAQADGLDERTRLRFLVEEHLIGVGPRSAYNPERVLVNTTTLLTALQAALTAARREGEEAQKQMFMNVFRMIDEALTGGADIDTAEDHVRWLKHHLRDIRIVLAKELLRPPHRPTQERQR